MIIVPNILAVFVTALSLLQSSSFASESPVSIIGNLPKSPNSNIYDNIKVRESQTTNPESKNNELSCQHKLDYRCIENNDSSLKLKSSNQVAIEQRLLQETSPSLFTLVKQEDALSRAESLSSLRQVAIVHRHGDRTPLDFAPRDPFQNESFWSIHGQGQLTNRGKERLFVLGKIMRDRYNQFLKRSVNKNMRISRASGSVRCIESAQIFLSSFLALNLDNSSDSTNLIWGQKDEKYRLGSIWQPASVLTTSASIDGMLAESAECNKLEEEYETYEYSEQAKNILIKYKDVVDVLRDNYGFVIDRFYKWFWASSFIEIERSYFPNRMPKPILDIYDRLQAASYESFVLYQSTLISKRLRVGLLLNDIITHMEDKANNDKLDDKQVKLLHYSAHDMTLITLLGTLDSYQASVGRPDYASNLIFELHKNVTNKEWFTKVFYMPTVPGQLLELNLNSCKKSESGKCILESFSSWLDKYRVRSWINWMTECKNDLTKINPYK